MVELVISTHEVLGSIPSPSIKKRGIGNGKVFRNSEFYVLTLFFVCINLFNFFY